MDEVMKNYRNPKNKTVMKRMTFIKNLIITKGRFWGVIFTVLKYWKNDIYQR